MLPKAMLQLASRWSDGVRWSTAPLFRGKLFPPLHPSGVLSQRKAFAKVNPSKAWIKKDQHPQVAVILTCLSFPLLILKPLLKLCIEGSWAGYEVNLLKLFFSGTATALPNQTRIGFYKIMSHDHRSLCWKSTQSNTSMLGSKRKSFRLLALVNLPMSYGGTNWRPLCKTLWKWVNFLNRNS